MWTFIALFLVSPAIAKKTEPPPPPPEPPVVENPAPPISGPSAGSLWDEVAARHLMGLDGNARQVGDLVTVRIREATATALDAGTRTERDSSTEAAIAALLGAEVGLTAPRPAMNGEIKIEGGATTKYDGSGATTRDAALEAVLTCEVIEVLDSGNLRIWGYKQVRVNREIQYVVLEGIVRPRDIRMDNTVESELLAQSKIEVTGSGVIADKQGPGVGTRLVDRLWPF